MGGALILAGTASGCGKTTATLGLMASLRRRGLRVQGFKVGPDYIDPGLHAQITGRQSWNLDGWMTDREVVRATFFRSMAGRSWALADGRFLAEKEPAADIGVIEGVMGLFDGAGGGDERGSTAEIAAWLSLPVVLVVDVSGMARSLAAVVRGFASLRPDVAVKGVVATRVAGDKHALLVREAMSTACPDIPLLACLPRDERVARPSRHLGLETAETYPLDSARQACLADWFERHADVARLIALAGPAPSPASHPVPLPRPHVRLAVARDAAFCFLYPALLEAFVRAGADLRFFSPLRDTELPPCDGVWLPGGYPELFVERLSGNERLAASLREAARQGMPVHGECGGYIWLLERLEVDGREYPMTGLLPGTARLGQRRAALGYRTVTTATSGPLGLGSLRGHEYHYSALREPLDDLYRRGVRPLWHVRDRSGRDLGREGLVRGTVSGSWIHLHPDSDSGLAERFVQACRMGREQKRRG